ncbi:MAG: hypothetical protein J2P49_07940 [Methylocapsa sp.]|nr:hypothetical protein [Methylocapsa sp.]
MKTLRASLLAGAAMIFAGAAQAQTPSPHVLAIELPGGTVEQIQYRGDTPPEVSFAASPLRQDWLFPSFGPDSPFAAIGPISDEFDRQAAQMLARAEAMSRTMPASPDELIRIYRSRPAGAKTYSFVSTLTSNGSCGRSIEITSQGDGSKPRVMTRSFGNCAGAQTAPRGSISVPAKSKHRPEIITARAKRIEPPRAAPSGMAQEAAFRY